MKRNNKTALLKFFFILIFFFSTLVFNLITSADFEDNFVYAQSQKETESKQATPILDEEQAVSASQTDTVETKPSAPGSMKKVGNVVWWTLSAPPKAALTALIWWIDAWVWFNPFSLWCGVGNRGIEHIKEGVDQMKKHAENIWRIYK